MQNDTILTVLHKILVTHLLASFPDSPCAQTLFCTASNGKLGGAWVWGYYLRIYFHTLLQAQFHSCTDLHFTEVLWSSSDDGVHTVAHREGMVPVVIGLRAVVSAHSEGEPEETVKVKLWDVHKVSKHCDHQVSLWISWYFISIQGEAIWQR